MNICRFNTDRLGIVEGGRVYDVTDAIARIPAPGWPYPPGDPLIRNLSAVLEEARRLWPSASSRPVSEVRLNSPVSAPTKVMAAPANYRAHIELDTRDPTFTSTVAQTELTAKDKPAEHMGLFLKASSSVVGPAEGLALQWLDRRNDPEVELVVVIGRTAKNVTQAQALEHVAGYTMGLDVTVRGLEDRSWRKSADSYALIGPWLTTADAIPDGERLNIWLDLNGERRQQSSTGLMLVGIRRLIELASSIYTLHPGDLLFTGTPEGVTPIKPGDRLRLGCDAIGEMDVAVN